MIQNEKKKQKLLVIKNEKKQSLVLIQNEKKKTESFSDSKHT